MNGAAAYILSVTAAAMVAAILQALAGQGTMGKLVGLLTGLFMTLTVITPLLSVELPDPEAWLSAYAADGKTAAAMGAEMADGAAHSFIKTKIETYILDKASLYGADIRAEVTLGSDGLPLRVSLTGDVSPYAKARLTKLIQTDLGIGEEAQQWKS